MKALLHDIRFNLPIFREIPQQTTLAYQSLSHTFPPTGNKRHRRVTAIAALYYSYIVLDICKTLVYNSCMKKDNYIGLRLDKIQVEALRKIAAKMESSVGSIIRMAINAYINK